MNLGKILFYSTIRWVCYDSRLCVKKKESILSYTLEHESCIPNHPELEQSVDEVFLEILVSQANQCHYTIYRIAYISYFIF